MLTRDTTVLSIIFIIHQLFENSDQHLEKGEDSSSYETNQIFIMNLHAFYHVDQLREKGPLILGLYSAPYIMIIVCVYTYTDSLVYSS